MVKRRTPPNVGSSGKRNATSFGQSTAPRVQAKKPGNLAVRWEKTSQQEPPVEKQVAEVFKQTQLYSLPYREMVTLGRPPENNKEQEFLFGSGNRFVYSSLPYFLQVEGQLPDLLLPEDGKLGERVRILWEDLLERVRSWRTWNARFQARRPLGTFFERNQWALWQATEKALRKSYSPHEMDLMVEEGLITESNHVCDSYEEWDAELEEEGVAC